MKTPIINAYYAADSRFPITVTTEDGMIGLTVEEAKDFILEIVSVTNIADRAQEAKASYRKEIQNECA